MKPDIIERLDLEVTALKIGDSSLNNVLIYTDGFGFHFAACNCLGIPTPGQVMVIDEETGNSIIMSEAELRFVSKEEIYKTIISKLTKVFINRPPRPHNPSTFWGFSGLA